MNVKKLLIVCSASGAAMCGCTGGNAHFVPAGMDTTVAPGTDFYQYSNGGWIANHPLPNDKSRFGTFDELADNNLDKLKEIVDEACKNPGAKGSAKQKIGDMYYCGMDTAARNADGCNALKPLMAQIDAIANPTDLAKAVAALMEVGVSPLFSFGSTPDTDNSSMNIAYVWQSPSIGLPDRDYYFDESEKGREIVTAYISMLEKLLTLAGIDNAQARANAVFDFEKSLAEHMFTKVENRNPQAITNKTDLAGLKAVMPNFDWTTFLGECNVDLKWTTLLGECNVDLKCVNISQPRYFEALNAALPQASADVVKDYLKLSLLNSYAAAMSDDFVNANFDFYGRVMRGTTEMLPLWKRSLTGVELAVGELLGQLFVEKHFPAAAKQRTIELIENLRTAFGQRIEKLTWMGNSTKLAAKEKLAAITLKVGYPDKWKDFSSLEIDRNLGHVANLMNAQRFDFKDEMGKINQPVDKTEWFMTPQTVNAYYSPQSNEIVFPAGILQPPFFYAEGDDAVNYGAIGVVIGHEMTHGFDDQGCQFDKEGNLKNWWTEQDASAFAEQTKRLAERFASFVVIDSLKINGELTLGENIADLGGLNIAYQAFSNTLAGKSEPAPIDGFTADQRFLLAYSRVWAGNYRDEYLRQQVIVDPHSPAKWRVNGQVPLLDLFYDAFGIGENDPMFVPKADRIVIW